jgi:hypothetical protein
MKMTDKTQNTKNPATTTSVTNEKNKVAASVEPKSARVSIRVLAIPIHPVAIRH